MARPQLAPRSHLGRGVDQLRRARSGRDRRVGVPVRRRGRHRAGDPPRADRAQSRHLARRAARRTPGPALRLPRRRTVGPRAGHALQPRQAVARPLCASGQWRVRHRPRDLRLRGRRGPAGHQHAPRPRRARLRAVRRPQRRGGRRLRLDRRPQDRRALAGHGHLRAARQGLHGAARPDPRGAARDVRRPRAPGGHRLPERPRRDGGGAASHPAVRLRAGALEERAVELLGLQHDRLLRPARGVLVLGRPRGAGARVQADGEELPRRRDRGATSTSSTTTPPRPGSTDRR